MALLFRIGAPSKRHLPLALNNFNKAANFSMVLCNGGHIPDCVGKHPSTLQNIQQSRSLWHGRTIQNASGSESYTINLDNLWVTKSTTGNEQAEPINDDNGAKQSEQKLARRCIYYGEQQQKWLKVQYEMGKSGQKFLRLSNKHGLGAKFINFPNILVPEDVFAFVRAMDEVLNALNEGKDKIDVQSNQLVVLHTAKAKGTNYDFELDLCMERDLFVEMRTVANERAPELWTKSIKVPIDIFCWMRRAIGEVFVENGEEHVQQQLGEPPSIRDAINRLEEQRGETIGKLLAQKFIRYGEQQQRWFKVTYQVGRTGQKNLHFSRNLQDRKITNFSKLRVPEDVPAFLRAMDEVLNEVEANEKRIHFILDHLSIHWNRDQFVLLHTAMAKGTNNDFELDLRLGQQVQVFMRSVPNERAPGHRPKFMPVPIEIFHRLRHAIEEIFVESGEAEVLQQLVDELMPNAARRMP